MSLKIDRLQLEIIINNDQSRKQLRELEDRAGQLTREMKKLDKTTAEYAQKDKELKGIKQQMDNIYESIGIAGLTMKELTNRQKELNAIMRNMDPRLPEYKKLDQQMKEVSNRIGELKGKSKDTGLSLGKIADGFNKYFALATAGVASLTGVIFSLRKVVDVANEFEKRVDNLSALTGLMGKDLDWLSEKAKKMSTSVIEGNIRITSSADKIVDAYTKVGSKRPELLKVKEDLNGVTQEAMILAAAADSELEPAVNGLTMVMNQFNMPASEARRIINVLAAGSKEGAGEVDYLTAAFEKSGSVASTLGISIEELTGVIETLAPRMSEPEMAGRNLRNIMIKLESQSDQNLKPSMVGLGKAFENLRDKQLTITQLVKLFGEENVNAANILMKNTQETAKYTAEVTNTNVALEQAAKNTDNNASKLEQAKNAVQKLSIEFGQKLAPAMTFSTNTFAAFMRVAMAAPGFFRQHQIAIIAMVGALLAYNASLIKSTALKAIDFIWNQNMLAQYIRNTVALNVMVAAERLKAIWTTQGTVATKLATTAQYAWNTAMKANPIGIIIAAITALVVAIKLYDSTSAETVRLEKNKKDAVDGLNKSNGLLKKSYEELELKTKSFNLLSAQQKKALLEQTDATLKQAEADLTAAKAKQELIFKENTRLTLWQKMAAGFLGANNPAAAMAYRASTAADNAIEASGEMNEGINALLDNINKLKNTSNQLESIVNAESLADKITGKSISQLEEKQQLLQTALKNYERGTADYERVSKKLQAVNKQLESSPLSDGLNELDSEFKKLNTTITDLDTKIENAIASGETPLAQKLQIEKKAAEDLLAAYEAVKNAIKQGWDLDQRDLGAIQGLISKGAGTVTGKDSPDNRLKFRKNTAGDAKPSSTISEAEAADQQKPKEWRDAEYQAAEILNTTITDMVMAKQNAQHEHKLALLDKEREKELSNKKLTEEQKEQINKKYDAKIREEKLKAWKKQRNADAISTTIATILAVMKQGGPLNPAGAITALAGAASVVKILTQPVPEFAGGKYLVTGAQSGRSYKADYAGPARTGMYTNPTLIGLVGENGPELIVDAATTRNLQMNYPAVIDAIHYARVPQYASGSYSSTQPSASAPGKSTVTMDPAWIEAMNRFSDTMNQVNKNGVKAHMNLYDLEQIQSEKASLEAATQL